jgi:propanol-preferring alcohol dehydrogenase
VAFFQQIQRTPVHCKVTCYPLIQANQALEHLRSGQLNGAIVLIP